MAKAKATRKIGAATKKGEKNVATPRESAGTKGRPKAIVKKQRRTAKATRKPIAKRKSVGAEPAGKAAAEILGRTDFDAAFVAGSVFVVCGDRHVTTIHDGGTFRVPSGRIGGSSKRYQWAQSDDVGT